MIPRSFTVTCLVDRTPEEVLAAVLDVGAWWSGDLTGDTRAAGDEFEYRNGDVHHSRIRVTEVSPERVSWRVLDTRLSFVEDQTEWVGTGIVFDIAPAGRATRLTFTHDGLVPDLECWDACNQGWTSYAVMNLRSLLESGAGDPAGDGTAPPDAQGEASVLP